VPKVLFITAWYPNPASPLAGVFVREQAKLIRQYGEVAVLHWIGPDPNIKAPWHISRESDDHFTHGIATYRVSYQPSSIPGFAFASKCAALFRAYGEIKANVFRPDIIHAHIYYAGLAALLVGKVTRTPVVISEHSSVFTRNDLKKGDLMRARVAFRWADAVLPVSKTLQTSIQSCGIKGRFHVLPNVVDTSVFYWCRSTSKVDCKRVLLVCALDNSDKKGVSHLLEALSELRGRREDWHLDIVGDGPGRRRYETLAEDLHLADKVAFHGSRPHREVAEFMRRADILTVPSRFETFSVVSAEALACGKPVLATRCGGPEEFIDKHTGLLVPPADSKALCDGLDYLFDHLDEFRPEVISQCATDRFGPEQIGTQLQAIYRANIRRGGDDGSTTEATRRQ